MSTRAGSPVGITHTGDLGALTGTRESKRSQTEGCSRLGSQLVGLKPCRWTLASLGNFMSARQSDLKKPRCRHGPDPQPLNAERRSTATCRTRRDVQLKTFEVLVRRMSAGPTEQSMIITGLRGVGKTVLLGRFRSKAQELDWVVVEREVSKHDDTQFRRQMVSAIRTALFELSPKARWSDRMKRAAAILKSFSVSVDPTGALTGGIDVDAAQGFADQQDLQADLTDLLVAVGEAAKDAGKGLVLLFDEVQFLSTRQLEALISALHKTVQRGLP